MPRWPRIVAHADMDAFYASVEQLDDPTLQGKPVLVGSSSLRGVVMTASYEARPYKVGSAMPMAEARRRCPHAIIVPPRLARYQQVSERIMTVFAEFWPRVEPLSLDEAFLEMTGSEHIFGPPDHMARAIQNAVLDATGLGVSVGIAASKYVAKVASGHQKPRGLTVVEPDDARAWLAPMPVARLWGAGPKTQSRLAALGLYTIGDVAAADPDWLRDALGRSMAQHFSDLAQARDPRPVARRTQAKSMSADRTLARDVYRHEDILKHLRRSADLLARRMRSQGYSASGVRVKLKTSQFRLLSRQHTLRSRSDVAEVIFQAAGRLLSEFDHPGPFRLVGLAVYGLESNPGSGQISLFEQGSQQRRLEQTLDDVAGRFGDAALKRASDMLDGDRVGLGSDLDFLDPD